MKLDNLLLLTNTYILLDIPTLILIDLPLVLSRFDRASERGIYYYEFHLFRTTCQSSLNFV